MCAEFLRSLRRTPLAAVLLLVSVVAACTSSVYGWTVRTNSTPRAASFHPGILEREPVAVFEALAPANLRGTELGLAHYLEDIVAAIAPTVRVISFQETVKRINAQGLAGEYVRMRAVLDQSNILEATSLEKLGPAIGARYVFQPRLGAFSQTMTERWSFVDVRIVQTRSSILRLSLQLWDTRTGELVWGSVSETILSNEGVSQDPVFLEDAARVALGSMITDLQRGKTSSTYTPLNTFLDQLIRKPEPESKPAPDN
jgi:hypothetical protein